MFALSIVIVNWNTRDLLRTCIQSLYNRMSGTGREIIVVDNASVDGSVELIRRDFAEVRLIANPENVGFVQANNQALTHCKGRYVLLLNSDTQILPGSLDKAVQFMDRHPRVGIAGGRLLNSDGSFQASYTPFPTLWSEFLTLSTLGRRLIRPAFPSHGPCVEEGPQRIEGYVEGACLVVRREAIDQVGKLDEHIFMYAEEVDWCYRFDQAGWEVWYLPQVPIIHHGGRSSEKQRGRMEAELYRSRAYFFHKHYGAVAAISLKLLIYSMTMIKMGMHGALRFVTGDRVGRPVTGWRELHLALSSVDSGSREGTTS
ncbi:MAG: glycosyltransferase family 2 protein [bacterium]